MRTVIGSTPSSSTISLPSAHPAPEEIGATPVSQCRRAEGTAWASRRGSQAFAVGQRAPGPFGHRASQSW
jgi:hypothetical protein